MKVAITGSNGFVGKHLMRYLRENTSLDLIELSRAQGVDVTKFSTLSEAITDVDCIIHLAAKTFVPDSFKKPKDFIDVNVGGTTNVLELARRKNAKVIFLSSYVYGRPEYLPIDETHKIDMNNPYCASKYIGENVCELYATAFGLDISIIRPFNVYGPGQGSDFLIPTILSQVRDGVVTLRDPRPKRDYIYINDLLKLILLAINKKNTENLEVFNAGSGKSYSIADIINCLKQNSSIVDFEVNYTNEYRPNEVLDTVANMDKVKSYFNWIPQVDLQEGIDKLIEYEMKNL